MAESQRKANGATVIGLLLALGAFPLLGITGLLKSTLEHFAPKGSIDYALLREAVIWSITGLVLLILFVGERLDFRAIGFKRITGSVFLWGFVGAVVSSLSYPVGVALAKAVGHYSTQSQSTFNEIASLPYWLVFLTVVRAGVCEEILYRGYGIERLTALTGSRALAAIVTACAFMAAHIGGYGVDYVFILIPITIVITGLYLWKRNLWINILAHFLTDIVPVSVLWAQVHHVFR